MDFITYHGEDILKLHAYHKFFNPFFPEVLLLLHPVHDWKGTQPASQ